MSGFIRLSMLSVWLAEVDFSGDVLTISIAPWAFLMMSVQGVLESTISSSIGDKIGSHSILKSANFALAYAKRL